MVVSVGHALPVEEARKRIDRDLDKILSSPLPAGLKLGALEREWKGDTLTASTKASTGIFSLNLGGTVTVSPADVTVDFDIPAMAKAFVSERDIETAVKRELNRSLA